MICMVISVINIEKTDFSSVEEEMERLNKFSDEQFIQPGICAEASQILLIAEQNRSIPLENS